MDRHLSSMASPPSSVELIPDMVAAEQLAIGDLSAIFNPFLRHFIREALRGEGEVWASIGDLEVDGILLFNQREKVGSIFTRDPAVAENLYGLKEGVALFSEFPLGAKAETYHIYAADPAGERRPHRFRHVVRMARAEEQPAIVRMLNEMYGLIDTSWLPASSQNGDKCFVVEVGSELVGAGWVSVVGSHGRLHSLSVRPHYRRVGIGTDLWHARMQWAGQAGACQVISEISEHNVASLSIATAGGMERIGRMFLSHRPGAGSPSASGDGRAAVRTDLVGHVD
jgi:GNAT superfamily N-acetyltransferase